MKIETNNNTVTFDHNNHKIEIHPMWLRERVNNKEFLDKKTKQRLFDPSLLEPPSEFFSLSCIFQYLFGCLLVPVLHANVYTIN